MTAQCSHRRSPRRLLPGLAAALLLALLCAGSAEARGETPRRVLGVACQGGSFEIDSDTRAPDPDGMGGIRIELLGDEAWIPDHCRAAPAHSELTRDGTHVHARWPRCDGFPRGLQLDATVDAETCSTLSGLIAVRGVSGWRSFTARQRLLSEDRAVDGGDPDGGERGSSSNTGIYKGFQRWYSQFRPRAYPRGYIPANSLEKALGQVALAPIAPLHWVSLGPAPLRAKPGDPTESPRSINSGRVDALAVDPWDPAHWLIGAATGGIWETRDAGDTWQPRSDDQASLAVSAIAFAPSSPNVAYAGTGAYNPLGASLYPGVGILKSIDGGETWGRFGANVFSGLGFGGIAVDPNLPAHVVAATLASIPGAFFEAYLPAGSGVPGVYRSTSGGASWELRLAGQATAVAAHPTQPAFFLYAGLARPASAGSNFARSTQKSGVFRSLDGGQTWTSVAGPWVHRVGGIGEVRIAVSPSSPDVLYVSIRDAKDGNGKDGYLLGVWRTSNAWAAKPTWTELSTPTITPYGTHALLVHGSDPDVVYLASGGPPLWKYLDGEWLVVSQSVPSDPNSADLIHVDHRALAWVGTQDLLVGNDGGVYLKNEVQDLPWQQRNEGLAITQFYAGAVDPVDPSRVLGGAQDNSVSLMLPPAGPIWKKVSSGDGNGGFFGGTLQQLAYFLQYGIVQRSLDGGATSTGAIFGIPDKEHGGNWLTRAARCPADPDQVIYGGFRIWKSYNFFSEPSYMNIAWAPTSPPMNLTSPIRFVTALAFAPSDASCATYAFADNTGKVSLTTDDGATWTPLDPGSALPGRMPTALAFGPASADTLWVAFSGYDAATPGRPGHLFRSDDATGPSPGWTNASPPVDLPFNAVAVHPSDPQTVYAGCDLGAWVTSDGGASWMHNGPAIGLPNDPVTDLHVSECSATAFTFGRGAFRSVSLLAPFCDE